MGFGNLAQYVQAEEAGRHWLTQFRKLTSTSATVASNFFDYTYSSGSPLANFYASTPLESAYVDPSRGIRVPSVAPSKQYLKNITAVTTTVSATLFSNQRQELHLCDYLMYYPFIDTGSTDVQETIAVQTLPRYTSGRVVAIAQSASSSVGQFTFSYTNQGGVSGRTSPNIFCQVVGGGGQSLCSYISGGGFHPYLPLAAGDSGVRSIESVTFTVVGGGLMALVIVHPLRIFNLASDSRRTTTGNLESYGAAASVDSVIHDANVPEIKDGAVLGFLTKGHGGSLASTYLVGYIETLWSE